ncbi:hypothetical protein [Paraglaciecola sp.]|uniref:hypothetical protein n=1 Tax=Paraglaciecola sp. TaxID=1920173 RepID=UPI003266280E
MKYLIFAALICCSCSQTTVHLYTKYLSVNQVQNIHQELAAKNFKVSNNDFVLPQTITSSTLIYSPNLQDRNAVDEVVQSLQNLNWNIATVSPLLKGNHWYSKNSIALMLVPVDITPNKGQAMSDWAHLYISHKCKKDIKLKLTKLGDYQLAIDDLDKNSRDLQSGTWKITEYPYIELRSSNGEWFFYFKVKYHVEQDIVGEIQMYELYPVDNYSAFEHCSFITGVRH